MVAMVIGSHQKNRFRSAADLLLRSIRFCTTNCDQFAKVTDADFSKLTAWSWLGDRCLGTNTKGRLRDPWCLFLSI
jgi:hypothetical protein